VLRTGTRLPVITIEHHWPWSYFIHKQECAEARSRLLDVAKGKAAVSKIPVPDPDPVFDKTFSEYIGRVYETLHLAPPTTISQEEVIKRVAKPLKTEKTPRLRK
jgi:macrodomain Ter protein organizer (MatP/YcbG family)